MTGQDVALITGGASGIGRALAIELSQRKPTNGSSPYKVYATDIKSGALTQLQSYGIQTLELDVTSAESIQKAVDKVLAAEGHIDLLVCNAGVYCGGFMAEIDYKDIERTFDVNVHGTFRVVQAVGPHMMAQRKGRIATMCDPQSCMARPFNGPYEGSKAALAMMSEGLFLELASYGVAITSVYSGFVRTGFLQNGITDFQRYEQPKSYYQQAVGYFKQLLAGFAREGPTPEEAAKDIADGLTKPKLARVIYTGASVWSTFWKGFLQQWVANGRFASYFIRETGLSKLQVTLPRHAQKQI